MRFWQNRYLFPLSSIVLILFLNGLQNEDKRFSFELEALNQVATACFYLIPGLLLIQSILSDRSKLKDIKIMFAIALCVLVLLAYFWRSLFDIDSQLIRRSNLSGNQVISLYEKRERFVDHGISERCRFQLLQQRIFPGLLRGQNRIGERECVGSGAATRFELYP